MPKIANNTPPVILASKSPRRKRMLENLEIVFTTVESGVDEAALPAGRPDDTVRALSFAKAEAVSFRYPDYWVIGADSIVAIDDTILNKPASREAAKDMLARLSGRTHRVLTGYAVLRQTVGHRFVDVVTSEVTFKTLSTDEIDWYTGTPEPYDKAGGYAIQGLGAFMIRRINGSYTNVVGLPLAELIDHLATCNAITRRSKPDRI